MKILYVLFLFIIFIIVAAFAVLNSQQVTLYYFLGQAVLPLAAPVIGGFMAGGIIGLMIGKAGKKKKAVS